MDVERAIQNLYSASRKAPMPADDHIICQQSEQALKDMVAELRRLRAAAQTVDTQVMEPPNG